MMTWKMRLIVDAGLRMHAQLSIDMPTLIMETVDDYTPAMEFQRIWQNTDFTGAIRQTLQKQLVATDCPELQVLLRQLIATIKVQPQLRFSQEQRDVIDIDDTHRGEVEYRPLTERDFFQFPQPTWSKKR